MTTPEEKQQLADLYKFHAYYKLALIALVRQSGGLLTVELGKPDAGEVPLLRHTATTRPDGNRVMHFDIVEKK
jgi:hypothetical protein